MLDPKLNMEPQNILPFKGTQSSTILDRHSHHKHSEIFSLWNMAKQFEIVLSISNTALVLQVSADLKFGRQFALQPYFYRQAPDVI
jgi:hypothetical protein